MATPEPPLASSTFSSQEPKNDLVAGKDGRSAAPPRSPLPLANAVMGDGSRPLEAGTRAFMESRFGHDFSRVRVHTPIRLPQSLRER